MAWESLPFLDTANQGDVPGPAVGLTTSGIRARLGRWPELTGPVEARASTVTALPSRRAGCIRAS
jgi:hypothetical protein